MNFLLKKQGILLYITRLLVILSNVDVVVGAFNDNNDTLIRRTANVSELIHETFKEVANYGSSSTKNKTHNNSNKLNMTISYPDVGNYNKSYFDKPYKDYIWKHRNKNSNMTIVYCIFIN